MTVYISAFLIPKNDNMNLKRWEESQNIFEKADSDVKRLFQRQSKTLE